MKRFFAALLSLALCLSLCACGKDAMVEETMAKIDAIGVVSIHSESKILEAEASYNALNDKQRNKVENYDKLKKARESYNFLAYTKNQKDKEEAARVKPMQDFAGKLIVEMANFFKNPLSIKVKNVWVWHNPLHNQYYFTFEIEARNGLGVEITEFYGTKNLLGFEELSDNAIKEARKNIHTWGLDENWYFCKDEITAMQSGEPLDADAIQQYFLSNYKK